MSTWTPLGLDFTCSTCHKAPAHDVAGSRYTPTGKDKDGAHIRGKVEQVQPGHLPVLPWPDAAHGGQPAAKLNQHTDKVACQTCHIPQFARGGVATKMNWDWSSRRQAQPGRQADAQEGCAWACDL